MENREKIFQEYYEFNESTMLKINELAAHPREDYFKESFKEELKFYGVNAIIMRTMLRYTRYNKSNKIIEFFGDKLRNMKVLDFGCGVGDYGMTIARCGAHVTFCDFEELIDFVKFRWGKENLDCDAITSPGSEINQIDPDYNILSACNFNLVVFGEVLEHINHPLRLLKTFYKVPYIFTSSFPFKREVSFIEPGHNINAYQEQKQCLEFLENNCKCHTLISVLKIWEKH